MNIKHLFLAAATLGVFAACSDYDPGMSENVVDYTDEELATIKEYAENFVTRYGAIDPNHTWGFGEVGSEDEAMSTRTSTNNPNNNQWVHLTINQDTREIENISTIDNQKVPGFPSDVDNLYHYYQDGQPTAITYAQLESLVSGGKDEFNPVGDVTDEEILYVSAWFRNHWKPDSDPLNTDKFFTQCISKDYDRTSYASKTGLINEGTSNWSEGNGVGEWDNNIPINLYKNGEFTTIDRNGHDVSNQYRQESFKLDQLGVKAPNDADYVHIYNNNAGNTSSISSTNPTGIDQSTWSALGQGIVSDKSYRSIMYVNETATTDFRAWSSGGSEWEYKWVLKHLTFTGRDGKNYDGWYLAFDMKYNRELTTDNSDWDNETQTYLSHWVQKAEKDYDGYYSNYIVKIVPGDGQVQKEDHQWYRVMCEDLGNTYDYDFNDLVYDVYFTGNSTDGYVANIKVQAAGGVYPIFIGIHDVDHEAHRLLGRSDTYNTANNQYKPLNVGGQTGVHDGILQVPVNTTNADLIPIYVEPTGKALERNVFILPTDDEVSEAPQKICIPGNTTKWTKENQNIEWAYPYFKDWVNAQDGTYGFPYKLENGKKKYFEADGNGGWKLVTDSNKTPWNTTDVDVEHKYLYY